ncbi:MAG TPA: hypothetical protein VFE47_16000 [Tepidisphaeraceae bacterium]|nr:hypothetical protein [Tepidisphaeraceae bacterium]
MLKEEIRAELDREPFVPLRVYLDSGQHYDIPIRRAAHILSVGLLVFIGMTEGGIRADGYDRFPFERVARIEHRRFNRRHPKKAS